MFRQYGIVPGHVVNSETFAAITAVEVSFYIYVEERNLL
jgi:hypothetical protein